jgi:hypothetical protein
VHGKNHIGHKRKKHKTKSHGYYKHGTMVMAVVRARGGDGSDNRLRGGDDVYVKCGAVREQQRTTLVRALPIIGGRELRVNVAF